MILPSKRLTHILVFLLNSKLHFLLLRILLQVKAELTHKEPVWTGGCSVGTNKALNDASVVGLLSRLLVLLSFGSEVTHSSSKQCDCKNSSFLIFQQLPDE